MNGCHGSDYTKLIRSLRHWGEPGTRKGYHYTKLIRSRRHSNWLYFSLAS